VYRRERNTEDQNFIEYFLILDLGVFNSIYKDGHVFLNSF